MPLFLSEQRSSVLTTLCAALHRPGMYLSFASSEDVGLDELQKAAPWIPEATIESNVLLDLWVDGRAYVLFDTYEEMQAAYRATVGDDGPTATNPYDGPARIYACTCNAEGALENENT